MPVPLPASETVSVKPVALNVAVTPSAALIITTQVPVPLQPAPLHPANAELAPAVAVSVTIDSLLHHYLKRTEPVPGLHFRICPAFKQKLNHCEA